MNVRFNLPVITLLLITVFGCVEEPAECFDCPTRVDNYFPLTEDSWWIYDTEITYAPDEKYYYRDTVSVDSIYNFDSLEYRVLTSNMYFMELVRKEDDVYFKRTLSCGFGPEYPFLKEDIGSSATIDFPEIPYFDISISEQRLPVFVVDGREYFDIIKVHEAYGSFDVTTYYANNIGMISRKESGEEYSMTKTIKDYTVIP
jgi:hypothetical protein